MITTYNALYIPILDKTPDSNGKNITFSGMKIIPSSSYKSLVVENPHLRHTNWGDFYSEVKPSELSTKLEGILGSVHKEVVFESLKLLNRVDLTQIRNEDELDADVPVVTNYGRRGVTLHIPMFEKAGFRGHDKETAYGLVSMLVLPKLFTDNIMYRGGTYREDCELALEALSELGMDLGGFPDDRDRYDLIHRRQ